MARHTCTALRAPGCRSAAAAPNIDSRIVFHLLGLTFRLQTSNFKLLTYHEGRNLSAAGRDVGEAGRAQARQEPGEAAPENVRGEIDQHVPHRDAAALADRKHLAPDRDALLRHPAAIALFDGARQRVVPRRLAGLPAERDAGAAVLVVRLDDVLVAVLAQVGEEIDLPAGAHDRSVLDDRGPRDVLADDLALLGREQALVPLVGQHREERLLVR